MINDRLMFRAWINEEKALICYGKRYIYFSAIKGLNTSGEGFDCIEQCTGLRDKNGKLIYEGDIIKIIDKSSRKEPFIGVVEYTNTASFESNCNGFYMHLHNPKTPENASMVEKMFCTSLREIEVLGNIHENADLLENEE